LVLRLKRLRNPDAVCLEKLEYFLRDAQQEGLVVLLAGVRTDILSAFHRLSFDDWFPWDHVFVEEDESDSATLKAVRKAYDLLGDENGCAHCLERVPTRSKPRAAYYLV
jgi:SulP family sulfate permease